MNKREKNAALKAYLKKKYGQRAALNKEREDRINAYYKLLQSARGVDVGASRSAGSRVSGTGSVDAARETPAPASSGTDGKSRRSVKRKRQNTDDQRPVNED